jgi:thioredoxin reductase (NADPH)
VDWANILANGIAAKIYLVHRRDQFRAAPASMAILESHIAAGRVEKITPYQLSALTGDAASGTLTAVTVTDLDGHARTLPCDALLCFFGLSTALGILERISLAQEGHGIIIDPTTAATSRTGIFAAGDIATYPHKLKLILTGFAEITAAAHSIYRHIHPDKPLHMVHSTTRGIPKT